MEAQGTGEPHVGQAPPADRGRGRRREDQEEHAEGLGRRAAWESPGAQHRAESRQAEDRVRPGRAGARKGSAKICAAVGGREHRSQVASASPKPRFVMPRFRTVASRWENPDTQARDVHRAAHHVQRKLEIEEINAGIAKSRRTESEAQAAATARKNDVVVQVLKKRELAPAWKSPSHKGPRRPEYPLTPERPRTAQDSVAAPEITACSAEYGHLPFWWKDQADAWELLHVSSP